MPAARERLDKRLAQEGLGTRSEIRKAIRAGKARVNGQTEKDPGRQILPSDVILFEGVPVTRESFVYYMMNKPAGVITATEDPEQRTVLDLLREREPNLRRGLFPVGRLDKDTEGLLLITDDGQLAHRLLSPGKHVDKKYYALVTGRVTEEEIRRFAEGLPVDAAFTARPARLEIVSGSARPEIISGFAEPEIILKQARIVADLESAQSEDMYAAPKSLLSEGNIETTQTLVTIREGKYHQIRRMFAALGKEVLYLKRLSMGTLLLDPALQPGEYRKLTEEEIRSLRDLRPAQ